jgi:hypothetical protein
VQSPLASTTAASTTSPTKSRVHLFNKHCFAHRLSSAAAPAKHATLAVAQSENNTRFWALAGPAKHFVPMGNSSLNDVVWCGTRMSGMQWNAHDEAPSSTESKGAVPTPTPGNFCTSWITTMLQPLWNAPPPAACQRPQKSTVTTVKGPHNVFELPDRVNNMFAIMLLLVMEWSLYLHLERHDWFATAALRTHPRPRNHRKLLTSNPVCERKPQRKASCTRQATTSVHTVVVVMALCIGLQHVHGTVLSASHAPAGRTDEQIVDDDSSSRSGPTGDTNTQSAVTTWYVPVPEAEPQHANDALPRTNDTGTNARHRQTVDKRRLQGGSQSLQSAT